MTAKALRFPFIVLIAGLLFVLPFIQPWHLRPLIHFYSEWTAAALGLVISILLIRKPFILSKPIAWLVGLIALILLQSVWQPPIYWASLLGPSTYLAGFGLLFITGSRLRASYDLETVINLLAFFALAGGLLQAVSSLIQLYGGPEWISFWAERLPIDGGVMGNAMQQNHFADHVMLGLASGIYLHATGKLRSWIFAILGLVILSALALSGSRSVIVYFMVLIMFSLAWWLTCRYRHQTDAPILQSVIVSTVLLFFIFWLLQWLLPIINDIFSIQSTTTVDRIEDILEGKASGIGVRLDLWYKAWLIFIQHPWWGTGVDSYAWQVWQLDRPGAMDYTMHSHNLLAETAVSLGIPGLVLLLGFTISWLRSSFSEGLQLTQWPVIAMILVIGVHSMLELPMWNLHFLLPFGLLLGLCVHPSKGRELPVFKPIILVLLVLMGVLIWHTAKSFHDLASLWLEKQSYSQVLQRYKQAARNPLLAPIAESSIADLQHLSKNNADAKIALYRKVIRYRPYPRAVFRQATLLGLAGHEAEGKAMMQRLIRLYPQYWKHVRQNYCNHPLISDDARQLLFNWTFDGTLPRTLQKCASRTS